MSSAKPPPFFAACALHGSADVREPSRWRTVVTYAPELASRHQYGSGSGVIAR